MVSVDKFLSSHSKRQKYLGMRIFVIFLLVIFALDTLYGTEHIGKVTVLNTLMLLFAPLFLEYLFGMDAYSGYTDMFRWIGLIISGAIVFVCILGYMGKIEIVLNNSEKINEILFFGKVQIAIVIKWLSYIMIINTFFDYIFTFNKREMFYYSMLNDIEQFIEEKYLNYKEKGSLENRKEQIKKEILSGI